MPKNISDEYKQLSAKYTLPEFSIIDNEFELSSIQSEHFILRDIRRKVADKLADYASFLEVLLNPDSTLTHLEECKDLSENDKSEILDVFRQLKHLERVSFELDLVADDKKTAEFINQALSAYLGLKPRIIGFLRIVQKSWLSDNLSKENIRYLG